MCPKKNVYIIYRYARVRECYIFDIYIENVFYDMRGTSRCIYDTYNLCDFKMCISYIDMRAFTYRHVPIKIDMGVLHIDMYVSYINMSASHRHKCIAHI